MPNIQEYDEPGTIQGSTKPTGVVEQLRLERQSLQTRIDEIDRALKELDKHPELSNLMDMLSRVSRRRY